MRARHADKFDGLRATTLLGKRGRRQLSPALDAEPQMPPAEKIAAAMARHSGPQAVAPAGFVPGAEPAEDDPRGGDPYANGPSAGEALAKLEDEGPKPSFTPNPPAMTGPMPRLGRPYVPASDPLDPAVSVVSAAPPVIGNSLPAVPPAQPAPAVVPPEYRVPLDHRALLYAEPGWTRALAAARIRNGEWDELPAIVERGLGRNASETATSFRHAREGIAEAARKLCATLGCPDQTGLLLRRVSEMVTEARNTGPQEAATGGAS